VEPFAFAGARLPTMDPLHRRASQLDSTTSARMASITVPRRTAGVHPWSIVVTNPRPAPRSGGGTCPAPTGRRWRRARRSTPRIVMLRRNLYTDLARAGKLAVLLGTRRALAIAVKNDNTEARFTQLAARFGRRLNGPRW
jgi:hypothetical protein